MGIKSKNNVMSYFCNMDDIDFMRAETFKMIMNEFGDDEFTSREYNEMRWNYADLKSNIEKKRCEFENREYDSANNFPDSGRYYWTPIMTLASLVHKGFVTVVNTEHCNVFAEDKERGKKYFERKGKFYDEKTVNAMVENGLISYDDFKVVYGHKLEHKRNHYRIDVKKFDKWYKLLDDEIAGANYEAETIAYRCYKMNADYRHSKKMIERYEELIRKHKQRMREDEIAANIDDVEKLKREAANRLLKALNAFTGSVYDLLK